MIKAIMSVLALALALTLVIILSGYVDYRKEMNSCIESGGLVVKSATGLKCVPRGRIQYI